MNKQFTRNNQHRTIPVSAGFSVSGSPRVHTPAHPYIKDNHLPLSILARDRSAYAQQVELAKAWMLGVVV